MLMQGVLTWSPPSKPALPMAEMLRDLSLNPHRRKDCGERASTSILPFLFCLPDIDIVRLICRCSQKHYFYIVT